jgi:hypothetical protein
MISNWDKYHEKLIRKWAEMSKTYSIMHSLCAQYYSSWHKRLGVPVVLLGGIAASSIFSNNHNNPEDTEFWNYINGGITLLMTGLAGISNFLSLEEKTSIHQNASFKYSKISLDIDTILSFSRNQRNISPEEFIHAKKAEILEIRENVPEILPWIVSEYLNNFNSSLTDTKSTVNKKPTLSSYEVSESPGNKIDDSSGSDISSKDKEVIKELEEISVDIQKEHNLENDAVHNKEKILSDFNDENSNKIYQACVKLKNINKVMNNNSDSDETDSQPEN